MEEIVIKNDIMVAHIENFSHNLSFEGVILDKYSKLTKKIKKRTGHRSKPTPKAPTRSQVEM